MSAVNSSAQLERVDLDGRITFRFTSPGSREEILRCLAESQPHGQPRFRAPVGVGVPGGP